MMDSKVLHTPEGVRDIYSDELQKKIALQNTLMKTFRCFGFQRIATPVFEFFDVFSKEIGTTRSNELYKFFDKEGNTLALRPDFTPSIARCAAKYYMEEELPLHFSYCGNTFVNTSDLQGKLKEGTETGIELIGGDKSDEARVISDAEVLHMAVCALKAAGLKDFQISIGNVEFLKGLCQEAGLSDELEEAVRRQISNKNYFGVEELILEAGIAKDKAEGFLKLTELFGDESCLAEAEKIVSNKQSKQALKHLSKVNALLSEMGDSDHISYDLGMVNKYNYYTGIIFRAYTYGVGDAILKGGRYDSLLSYFGKDAAAIGFVIPVDELMSAMVSQKLLSGKKREIDHLVYDSAMAKDALKLADVLRSRGDNMMCSPYSKGKDIAEYVAYGNRNLIRKLYHLTSDGKILVYDLSDDSPDGLPVDNLELTDLIK
ncbi:MAG: ATP phosphoribosyltransferase regulatory subunit [Lachnospiraceae bacterium]|nr:ATP phosphoribosyltransferase regulatory subunit [Lachnospiraceae bacterium]